MGAKDSKPSCISYEDAVKRGKYRRHAVAGSLLRNFSVGFSFPLGVTPFMNAFMQGSNEGSNKVLK